MLESVRKLFEREKIEYFAAADYSFLEEINPKLITRSGFPPKSVIVFLLPYYTGETVNISRYSASLDYHIIIKEITDKLIRELKQNYPEYNFAGFGDHSPINEREAALSCGLGILGDNGLIINEKYGSYVFIAEILTDLPPDVLGAAKPEAVLRCEGCGACKKICPTGCLSDYEKECLSAITQKKGDLSFEEIALIRKHRTVWGCDACQYACPHNSSPVLTPIDFFYKERIEELTSDILNAMSDEEFKRRAFAWRGRKTVERNLGYFESEDN